MLCILLAFAIFVGVCNGASGSNNRYGPTIEKYPSLVQVEYFNPQDSLWRPYAGGTIVASNIVLSYGQFFHKEFDSVYSPEFRRIRAGATYNNRGGVISTVASAITHPDYLSDYFDSLKGSLCIVRLRDHLSFGSTISAVPIPPQNWQMPNGLEVQQAGWGMTPLYSPPFETLAENTAITIGQTFCNDRYTNISNDTICSGYETYIVRRCPNDFGGPVYFGGVLVGVFIAGGCRIPNRPSVSTQVSNYTDWIIANAN